MSWQDLSVSIAGYPFYAWMEWGNSCKVPVSRTQRLSCHSHDSNPRPCGQVSDSLTTRPLTPSSNVMVKLNPPAQDDPVGIQIWRGPQYPLRVIYVRGHWMGGGGLQSRPQKNVHLESQPVCHDWDPSLLKAKNSTVPHRTVMIYSQ
jgi:hypothetical protein